MEKYVCGKCGWVYNPTEGFPVFGVKPGTPFESLPETFSCPVCSARKQHFLPGDSRHAASESPKS